jgi:ArsR family transcriptional regulator
MGTTTTLETLEERIGSIKLHRASELLRSAAHPQRLAILDVLGQHDCLCNRDMQEALGIDQAILSQQLTLMRDKGLIDCERKGKFTFWRLKDRNFVKIVNCLEASCETL